MPPYKRDVNTVFQSYALFPHLNVEKNVSFGLERKKVSKADVQSRVNETLEMVQLGGYGRRKPAQLSGGQQQRVALARALVNRPRALLLDEPLGALDLRLRKQLQIELKRIQQDVGITFVHVTHDQEEAMSMADTIAVMNEGRIEQAGGAADLYERPRTEFVANFLGVSNLVDARLRASQNGHSMVETHDGATLHVPTDRIGPHGTDAVRIGVRPEKVTLSPPARRSARAAMSCGAPSWSPRSSASRSSTWSEPPAARSSPFSPRTSMVPSLSRSAPAVRSSWHGTRSTPSSLPRRGSHDRSAFRART